MAFVSLFAARRKEEAQYATPEARARILIHAINDDRCTGCDACVAVCPTNVLDLVDNKSRVLRFQDCIQCEQCMWACPTDALVMHLEGSKPPNLLVPELDSNFQTQVAGQYLIGEVAGKPLVKNAANIGRGVIEHMVASGLRPGALSNKLKMAEGSDASHVTHVDVCIVGSGPGGLSAALSCIQRDLSYVLLDKENIIASTVARYPKGKLVMAEPYDVRNVSLLPVFDSSKEQLLPIWKELIAQTGLQIKLGEAVEAVKRRDDGIFSVRTTVAKYRAQRVVLATGTRGKPRTLGVQGENLPKVESLLDDPDIYRGKPVLVVGGGDSAVEAAIALADAGAKVVMSYRGRQFSRAQAKNKKAIASYASQRRIKIKLQSSVTRIDEPSVTIKMADGSEKRYANAAVFVLIGSDPPVKWLEKLGVHFVERPHSYALPATDELVQGFLGNVAACPDDAASAGANVLGGRVPEKPMHIPEHGESLSSMDAPELTGPRKWIRSATSIFTSARKSLDGPMPLSEFAAQSRLRHTGAGRRDQLSKRERTRVLRMLRDEGGRLADEESQVYLMNEGPSAVELAGSPIPELEHDFGHKIERIPGIPRMTGRFDEEDSSPKQAVIVGLARAMARGPKSKSDSRRRRPSSVPPPIPGARPQVPVSPKFIEAATVQARPSALEELLADASSPFTRAPAPNDWDSSNADSTRALDFDPIQLMAKAEAPLHIGDSTDVSAIIVPSRGVSNIDFDSGILLADDYDDSTRAVDVSGLAALERHGLDENNYNEATRAVDLGRADSLSDIDWDLD